MLQRRLAELFLTCFSFFFFFLVSSQGESRKSALQSAKNVVVERGKAFVVPCFLLRGGEVISLNAISVDVRRRAAASVHAETALKHERWLYWTTFGRAVREFFIAGRIAPGPPGSSSRKNKCTASLTAS